MLEALIMDNEDNVATAIINLNKGEKVNFGLNKVSLSNTSSVLAKEYIAFGHKIALSKINKGEEIIKYGEVIGKATKNIDIGCHIHTHNLKSLRGNRG